MNYRGRDGAAPIAAALDAQRAEYRAAKSSKARARARGLAPMGAAADFHYSNESDLLRIGELAWDCDRNDPVVGQGVDRLIDLVFRDGMICDPDTGNSELDALIKTDIDGWAEDRDACDISGKSTLHDLARLAARHCVVAGDAAVLTLESGHLEGVESYRLRTPRNARNDRRKQKVVHGVVLDDNRRPVEYWFTKDDIGTRGAVEKVEDMRRVAAYDGDGHRQVLHIFNPKRLSQSRGVSALAPILETAAQHDDLQYATLIKAQTSACFALLVEQAESKGRTTSSVQLGPRTEETSSTDGFLKILEQIAPGLIYKGKPGEKVQGFTPNVPNAEFFEHAHLILTIIAVNLGIPVQVLLLDPSDANFSSLRGAMDFAKVGFRRIRKQMIQQFYRPIYQWRVRRLLASNERAAEIVASTLVDSGEDRVLDAFRHFWKSPHDPYIEPSKDAAADKLIVETGLDSRRNVLGARGLNIEVVDRDRVHDAKRLILLACSAEKQVKEEYPEWDGSWRDFIAPIVSQSGGGSPESGGEGPAGEEDDGSTTKGTKKPAVPGKKGNSDA